MSNPKTTKPEFSQSSTIESALQAAGYQSAKEILEPKPKPKPTPIKPPSPIPIKSKPAPPEPVSMDIPVPVKDNEIANLKKERAELELQMAKIRKEEAEKEKLRRNGFLFFNGNIQEFTNNRNMPKKFYNTTSNKYFLLLTLNLKIMLDTSYNHFGYISKLKITKTTKFDSHRAFSRFSWYKIVFLSLYVCSYKIFLSAH